MSDQPTFDQLWAKANRLWKLLGNGSAICLCGSEGDMGGVEICTMGSNEYLIARGDTATQVVQEFISTMTPKLEKKIEAQKIELQDAQERLTEMMKFL